MKLILCMVCLCIPVLCHALFDRPVPAARPAGMANAFGSIANDLNALRLNPAGLALMYYPQAAFNYSNLYPSMRDGSMLKDNQVSFGLPLTYATHRNDGAERTILEYNLGTVAIGYRQFAVNERYIEETTTLGYAREAVKNLYYGISVNMLSITYSPGMYADNAVANDGSFSGERDTFFDKGRGARGTSVDAGLSYQWEAKRTSKQYDRYLFSLSSENLFATDMSIGDSPSTPPRTIRLSAGYDHPALRMSCDFLRTRVTPGIRDNRYAFGMERWFSLYEYGRVAARSGLAFGSTSNDEFSLGWSYLYKRYLIDYAYVFIFAGLEDAGGEHLLSFAVRFGDVGYDFEPNPILRSSMRERAQLAKEVKRVEAETDRQKQTVQRLQHQLDNTRAVYSDTHGGTTDVRAQYREGYAVAMKVYADMTRKAVPLTDQRVYLKKLTQEYADTQVDVSTAKSELKKVNTAIKKGQKEYIMRWNYYLKLKEKGADTRERKRVLLKMKKQFQYLGIELNDVIEELRLLERKQQ